MIAQEFDYVVVGGGTAGCALAARLSEDSATDGVSARGGRFRQERVHQRTGHHRDGAAVGLAELALSVRASAASLTVAAYRCRAGAASAARRSSTAWFISGETRGTMTRGPPPGPRGWSYREVLPYFRKSEHNENFAPGVYHGRGGPMNVRSVTRPESSQLLFL